MAAAQSAEVTADLVKEAQKLAGLELTDDEVEMVARTVSRAQRDLEELRAFRLPNDVLPALQFNPLLPGTAVPNGVPPGVSFAAPRVERPADLEEAAFWPITQLSALIKNRLVTSRELTEMYLRRLKKYDEQLHCVVSLTEALALEQADRADREIAAGNYRGPLHGIPWGAKDLLATKGYRTTWGAKPFEEQIFDVNAAVVERLEQAGAVLVAKLTLGALAMGDVWYGGKTRNPWNTEQGSSGSSAGPGAATAAGLVGFSIGTETLGSIVSPSTACGVTGLRPTFGRVSRYGAMALSWSMDKIGPMCRSAADCALVLDAIHGPDERDPSLITAPFGWHSESDIRDLRIGYLEDAFSGSYREKNHGQAVLDTFDKLGVERIPLTLPSDYPLGAMRSILNAEAAAAFDDLTRSNRDDLLVRQQANAWPNIFRAAHFTPAVDYIQANRVRTRLMEDMARVFEKVDVFLSSPYGGNNLLITNLTGHPAVVMPNGFSDRGMPTSVTVTASLFREDHALSAAHAFQEATDHHRKRPPLA